MKKILIILAIILFSCNNTENKDIKVRDDITKLKEQFDSLDLVTHRKLSNIKFATHMTINEVKMGMSKKRADKYYQHLMDSLTELDTLPDSVRVNRMQAEIDKDKNTK